MVCLHLGGYEAMERPLSASGMVVRKWQGGAAGSVCAGFLSPTLLHQELDFPES